MAELHEALKWLSPIDWSDVPTNDLASFAAEANAAGELICNSVPPPADGTSFHDSSPSHTEPNQAKSASDIHNSEARPHPPHDDHEQLKKSWGKPVKINARDNPLNAVVYKMAGKDRHGAWFARSSIHEGIGFDKFKRALQREFPHSLSIIGGPGAGAVRGIAADRRVESKKIDEGRQLEVLQLSAQFPGPTTAREFNTLLITSDSALSGKSAVDLDGQSHVPRHFMVVSKPVNHPELSDRSGYVKGQYESVEMIREIPLHKAKTVTERAADSTAQEITSKDAKKGKKGTTDESEAHDPELNPVEWVMVTRSDPGGGIPRFLVDRGTPDSMLGDLKKFFDWACAMEEIPDADEDLDKQEEASENTAKEAGSSAATQAQKSTTVNNHATSAETAEPGILSSIGQTLHNGINAYAPAIVSRNVNHYVHFEAEEDSSDSSDESSIASFASASEGRIGVSEKGSQSMPNLERATTDSVPGDVPVADENNHDREARKVVRERAKLNSKLASKREEEEDKYQKALAKDGADEEKLKEKRDKELLKLDEKHKSALRKSLRKEEKERKKADEKRKKRDDGNKLNLVVRERDDFRTQADLLRRENGLLVRQVEGIQLENQLLTQELQKLGAEDVLRSIREKMVSPRSRTSSLRSAQSDAKASIKS